MYYHYTKEQLLDALAEAVGGTPYGDILIEKADCTWGDQHHRYGRDFRERLEEALGIIKAYVIFNRDSEEDAKAASIDEKIATVEKALKAVEEVVKSEEY